MIGPLSMNVAVIIAACVAALSIALVSIVGGLLKPDPQPRLYSSAEEFIEKEAVETNHE